MRKLSIIIGIIAFLFLYRNIKSQIMDNEELWKKETTSAKAIDFSKYFEKDKMSREDFENLKQQKEAKLKERLSKVGALEIAIDPEKYIIGPGDAFSFNIWGPMEMQYSIVVNPEGELIIPSVGQIKVDGKKLGQVQALVVEKSKPFYESSKITLTIDVLRFFRVHVVGEVKYPGTYIAQAVNRVSELIEDAGGLTEWAWKREIEVRHLNGQINIFDLSFFEQTGALENNFFVNGGDIIFVPPISMRKGMVKVESDIEVSGLYQIMDNENILDFLQRIRSLKKNTKLSTISVIRLLNEENNSKKKYSTIKPFQSDTMVTQFKLMDGDQIILPSSFVYVKGAVRTPGAFPYSLNMRARDYVGMAGGDYHAGDIKGIKIYHALTGRTEKGPDVLVEPGDIIHLSPTWNERYGNYIQIIPIFTSLILAAKAAGVFGN